MSQYTEAQVLEAIEWASGASPVHSKYRGEHLKVLAAALREAREELADERKKHIMTQKYRDGFHARAESLAKELASSNRLREATYKDFLLRGERVAELEAERERLNGQVIHLIAMVLRLKLAEEAWFETWHPELFKIYKFLPAAKDRP